MRFLINNTAAIHFWCKASTIDNLPELYRQQNEHKKSEIIWADIRSFKLRVSTVHVYLCLMPVRLYTSEFNLCEASYLTIALVSCKYSALTYVPSNKHYSVYMDIICPFSHELVACFIWCICICRHRSHHPIPFVFGQQSTTVHKRTILEAKITGDESYVYQVFTINYHHQTSSPKLNTCIYNVRQSLEGSRYFQYATFLPHLS